MIKVNTQPQTDVNWWKTESVLLGKRLLVVHVVAVLLLRVKVPAAQRTLLITLETDTHTWTHLTGDTQSHFSITTQNHSYLVHLAVVHLLITVHSQIIHSTTEKKHIPKLIISILNCTWQKKTWRRNSRGRVALGVTVWHPKEISKMLLLFTSASSAHG